MINFKLKFITDEVEPMMEDPSEEIKETDKEIDSLFEVISNLKNIQKHVKKFGITKEFLHLVNTDNQLSKSIGISLPYYEDDNAEIEIDNVPESETIITATENVVTNIKNKMISAFKWLKEKMIAFFKWLWDLVSFNKKKVSEVNEDLKSENIVKKAKEKAEENGSENPNPNFNEAEKKAADQVMIKFFNKKLALDLLKAFDFGFTEITKLKIVADDGIKIVCNCSDFITWQKALGVKGYFELSENSDEFVWVKDDKYSVVDKNGIAKDTLKNLGYSSIDELVTIGEHIIKISVIFEKIMQLKKDMEGRINRIIKMMADDQEDLEFATSDKDKAAIQADIDDWEHNKKLITSILRLVTVYAKLFIKFTKHYTNTGVKFSSDLINFYSSLI